MKEFAERFYKSKAWQRTRETYCKSRACLCEECLKRGEIVPGEIVHHIKPITEDNINNPDITLSWDNLRLLCRSCHEQAHRKTAKRWTVDEYGHVHIIGQ